MQNQRSSKKALLKLNIPLTQRQTIETHKSKASDTKQATFYNHKKCRFCAPSNQPIYHIKIKLQQFEESNNIKTQSTQQQLYYNRILNHSLTMKYSQSQTYYYTKPINEYLHNQRCSQVILLKEIVSFSGVDGDEWLRRLYGLHEIPNKLHLLSQYYRFHNEIPRLFMLPESDVMNNYHDKKRRVEYFRISKEIENENRNNPNKPPKGIVGDRPDVKQDSQENTPSSTEVVNKVYGNILQDITLESKKTNISFTVQEINQKLEDLVNRTFFNGLEKQLEIELQIKSTKFDDDLKIKEFFSQVAEKDYKPALKAKIKKDLRLDEEVLKTIYSNGTTNQKQSSQSPPSKKQSTKIVVKQPQSARAIIPLQYIIPNVPQVKTTVNKVANAQPFFMSQALQMKLQIQQNIVQQNNINNKQGYSISPRNITKQTIVTQPSFTVKHSAQKNLTSLQCNQIQSYRSLLGQGQGSQKAYQVPLQVTDPNQLQIQIMSAKNYTPQTIKPFFPTANTSKQISQNNFSKNTSKISALVTAESSPTHMKPTQIVGSQTQRVTSQKDIQTLLKLQQLKQQQIYDGISKDALNKILTPAKTTKQMNDFFLQQLNAINVVNQNPNILELEQQSNQIGNQLVRRNPIKVSKQRKSMNLVEIKVPSGVSIQHHYAKSDINQDMQKLAQVLNDGNKRISKLT